MPRTIILTRDLQRQWSERGLLVLRDVLSAGEIEQLDEATRRVEMWANVGGPGLHHHEMTDTGPALARSEMFVDDEPALRKLIRGAWMSSVLELLFGEPAVLFKEKVNYKMPGGAGFAPHQDAAAYRFVDHHISVMVPLDPSTVASGCLEFAAGHTRGLLPTTSGGRIEPDVADDLEWFPVEATPGDVVFFDSYAPHRSGTNTSDRARRTHYLTYNARAKGDFRERYYADKIAEFDHAGATTDGGEVRLSITDDFLGRPVA